ncbi:hypothetical protein NBRC3277_2465 [Acetobacter pasteurianus NBRC 3277]|nr:hypothetical protein NBRC3277_2465 [Acetobacter pasteurianus NBRC 3277]
MVEQGERDQHKACQRGQLELDQRDKELHGENEERRQHDQPGQAEHEYLDEIRKERDRAEQIVDRVQ